MAAAGCTPSVVALLVEGLVGSGQFGQAVTALD